MIICFKCPSETKRVLDALTASGNYADYSEVITVAIHNLLVMQEQIKSSGVLVLPSSESDRTSGAEASGNPLLLQTSCSSEGNSDTSRFTPPGLFRLPVVGQPTVWATMPLDVFAGGQPVQIDRWLFGQYNKILPAKASCRGLANLLVREQQALPIEEAASVVAEAAIELGTLLADLDRRLGHGRDDALATAFPVDKDPNHKGRARFATQFVADVNRNGQVTGLLADLKLVNRVDRRSNTIALTKAGWDFAALPNPTLDACGTYTRLSDEEITFLLKHITSYVPVEDFAYRTILAAVRHGADTPSTLDAALRDLAPTDKELTETFLSTQRSGAVSRMVDLGLLIRVREGVRMTYQVSEVGLRYLDRSAVGSRV